MSTRKEKTGDLNLVPAYSSSGSSGITDAACVNRSGEHEHEDEKSDYGKQWP